MAVSIVGSDLLVGRRTRVPFALLHGGEGDVVRLRETIVRTLRKTTWCGEARGIKADSHTLARLFVCVMMQNRRERINGNNSGIAQSQRRSKLNRECLMN